MIKRTQSYQTSDGAVHGTLEEAQRHELHAIVEEQVKLMADGSSDLSDALTRHLLANATLIIDILTTGPRSRPTRRLANGAKPPTRRKASKAEFPTETK